MKKNIYKTHRREFLGKRTNCNTASYWQTHLFFWRWAGVFPGLQRQDVGALPCYFLSVVASFLDAELGYSHTVYITGLRSSECVWGDGHIVFTAGWRGSEEYIWGMVRLSILLRWMALRGVFRGWSYSIHSWVEWLWRVCLGDGQTVYTVGLRSSEECVCWLVCSCLFESDNKL